VTTRGPRLPWTPVGLCPTQTRRKDSVGMGPTQETHNVR